MTVSIFAAGLSFICNQPHFLGSYTLLYFDSWPKLFRKFRYFFVGVIVPVALILFFSYTLYHQDAVLLSYAVNLMFFLVGWHYVKQIFGCVVVSSVRSERFWTRFERRIIWINLMSVWFVSISNGPYVVSPQDFHGLSYITYPTPWVQLVSVISLFAISFFAMVAVLIRKYIKTGHLPPAMAVIAVLSIYIWFLPSFHHPVFNYMVPFFHSLQYLVLAGQFKYNKENFALGNLTGEARRMKWFKSFIAYWTIVFILGMAFFEFVPNSLDAQGFFPANSSLGATPFMVVFLLFINIHHYFIDSAIWRSDNEEVRKFLFAARPRRATQPSTPPFVPTHSPVST